MMLVASLVVWLFLDVKHAELDPLIRREMQRNRTDADVRFGT